MKWHIETTRKGAPRYKEDSSSDVADIKFTPENRSLEYFLNGIKLIKYPDFLKAYNERTVFSVLSGRIKFFRDLDWEDLEGLKSIGPVNEGDIVVYNNYAKDVILKEIVVDRIVLDYSKHIFNQVKDIKDFFDDDWSNKMNFEMDLLEKCIQELPSTTKFNKQIFADFKPIFAQEGFIDSKHFTANGLLDFYNKNTESIHCIRLTFSISRKKFIQLKGLISFPFVTDILQQFRAIETDYIEPIVVNYYLYENADYWAVLYKYFGTWSLKSPRDIEDFKLKIVDHVTTHILPFFEKIPDLQSVNNEIINSVPPTEYFNYFQDHTEFKVLIIMKICNNPEYEAYKNWALGVYKKGFGLDMNKYEADYTALKLLIAYLDN